MNGWPEKYTNNLTKAVFRFSNNEVETAIKDLNGKQFLFLQGGEGTGKTLHSLIFALERVKMGQTGIFIFPDWPLLSRNWSLLAPWLPWDNIVEQKYKNDYKPYLWFELNFVNQSHKKVGTLFFGGCTSSDKSKFFIDRLNEIELDFAVIDEARHFDVNKNPFPYYDAFEMVLNSLLKYSSSNIKILVNSTPSNKVKSYFYQVFNPKSETNLLISSGELNYIQTRLDIIKLEKIMTGSPEYIAIRHKQKLQKLEKTTPNKTGLTRHEPTITTKIKNNKSETLVESYGGETAPVGDVFDLNGELVRVFKVQVTHYTPTKAEITVWVVAANEPKELFTDFESVTNMTSQVVVKNDPHHGLQFVKYDIQVNTTAIYSFDFYTLKWRLRRVHS